MIPRIKSSHFFALLCLLCIASGNITTFLIYMLAVLSHECAHCVMANMLVYEVCSIELCHTLPRRDNRHVSHRTNS